MGKVASIRELVSSVLDRSGRWGRLHDRIESAGRRVDRALSDIEDGFDHSGASHVPGLGGILGGGSHLLAGFVQGAVNAADAAAELVPSILDGRLEQSVGDVCAGIRKHPMELVRSIKDTFVEGIRRDPADFLGQLGFAAVLAAVTGGLGAAAKAGAAAGAGSEVAVEAIQAAEGIQETLGSAEELGIPELLPEDARRGYDDGKTLYDVAKQERDSGRGQGRGTFDFGVGPAHIHKGR